ncbi:unnamed protein product (macronuclear) [Paramecium tetraurelia]|uniref:Uncharacterized protein n=1 Tax=Paramecium tetraurelia TaxID=5888 RepID=A0E6C2_PARTE|nr:uncharacterized protein GSPATT00003704001 [Paramecium tetraurelia]CAK90839.1 unnamed protein product [Paramecium tetraurelia]|eukprot:XP_001458236.1 hypothetical protein (macronuclear) [Paramecium tetraurelia strain d4-2]
MIINGVYINSQLNLQMKQNARNRFCDLVHAIKQRNPERCLIMILDSTSAKILSSMMKLKDLIDMGVSTIEKLELQRKPYPKHDAFYFITPSDDSVNRLINDFKEQQMYRKINVIFSYNLPQRLLEQICKSNLANQFNHHLYFLEENAFHFQIPQIHFDDLVQVVQLFLSSLPSMRPFQCVKLSTINTNQFAQLFTNYLPRLLENWERTNQIVKDDGGGELHFLILDRTFDLLTPLLHDFHYESLVVDLLPQTFSPFECEDSVYQKYRYKHIAYALEGIPQEFQKMVNTNPSALIHKGDFKELDTQKMQEIMNSMPNYNSQLKDFTFHMNQIDQIWKQFETKGLKDLGELEQALATGTTKQGNQTKSDQLYQEVLFMLQSKIIQDTDKIRLVLIILLTVQMPEYERKQILEKITDLKPFYGLQKLGFDFDKMKSNRITKNINKESRLLAKQKLSQMTLELQRHTPEIEKLLNDLLNENKFNTVTLYGQNSSQKYANAQQSLRSKKEEQVEQISVCIFILGGISHSEVCAIRNYYSNKLKQVFIGSTQILSPSQYLDQLRSLSQL